MLWTQDPNPDTSSQLFSVTKSLYSACAGPQRVTCHESLSTQQTLWKIYSLYTLYVPNSRQRQLARETILHSFFVVCLFVFNGAAL